jgi:DNA-binding transcriptional ArsR family regulator
MGVSLIERYAKQIVGTVDCLDRVVIMGTLPGACYAQGMTSILYGRGIRIFDYAQFAKPLAEQVRTNAERLAAQAGIEIEYIRKLNFRKEDRVRQILQERGEHPGLVHVFSALESCAAYQPWHDKRTGKTFLRPDSGKCLHYYFYFIDPVLGLCYLRVPTWCPFRLQFYFNGHNWLKRQLARRGIACELIDNVIVDCADWSKAQEIAEGLEVKALHRLLDRYAKLYCPAAVSTFGVRYHWSIMQAEYAHDIVFKSASDLAPLYESITRSAVQAVKVDQIATFLSRKFTGNYQGEAGGSYSTRIEGTCIKHHMGRAAAIKMYDKFGRVLRIETTVNNVSFFKHHRKVEHRDGTSSFKLADLPKSLYSLPVLRELMAAANRRYLAFIGELPDDGPGLRAVQKLAEKTRDPDQDRAVRGFNLLQHEDHGLFCAIARGEFAISGMTNRRLREVLKDKTASQLSRLLRALRMHGLIKKIGRTYKYYLTELGRRTTAAALKLRELVIVPAMAQPA